MVFLSCKNYWSDETSTIPQEWNGIMCTEDTILLATVRHFSIQISLWMVVPLDCSAVFWLFVFVPFACLVGKLQEAARRRRSKSKNFFIAENNPAAPKTRLINASMVGMNFAVGVSLASGFVKTATLVAANIALRAGFLARWMVLRVDEMKTTPNLSISSQRGAWSESPDEALSRIWLVHPIFLGGRFLSGTHSGSDSGSNNGIINARNGWLRHDGVK